MPGGYSPNPGYNFFAAPVAAAPQFEDDDPFIRRRKLADALFQQGLSNDAPIRSPLQGVARVATQALNGYLANRADTKEKETSAKNRAALAATLAGGNFDSATLAALVASPDETAQKFGMTLFESNLKHKQALDEKDATHQERLDEAAAKRYTPATPEQKSEYGYKPTDRVVMSPEGEPKSLDLKLPMGWTQDAGGNFIPIPGGPADPAYLGKRSAAERKPDKVTPTVASPYTNPAASFRGGQ